MNRDDRIEQFEKVVFYQTHSRRGYATVTSVANAVGLSPSLHVRGILQEMVRSGKIYGSTAIDGRGYGYVHRFRAICTCEVCTAQMEIPF